MKNFYFEPGFYQWVVLPLLIFIARVIDVSLATIRIVFIARGIKFYAAVLGFFEVLIWLFTIAQVFHHLNNIACYIGFAAGFAAGNYIGIVLEQRLAMGMQILRIITRDHIDAFLAVLREKKLSYAIVDGRGPTGPVKIIFMVCRRKDVPSILHWLPEYLPDSFYTIENVQTAAETESLLVANGQRRSYWYFFRFDRRRK